MSGLIPQPFIDDLLHRTDLVELVDSYVPLKKRGTSHVACCPFHNEKSPSFNVVAKKQFYHCFGCGASGNAISFVMNYLSLGFIEAVETLASRLGMTIPRDGQTEKNNASQDLYKLLSTVSLYYQKKLKEEGQPAINYLRSRGLSGKIAKLYQLGFATDGWRNLEKAFPRDQHNLIVTGMLIKNDDGKIYDRYRNRIMFPIHDRHGRIIGFGGRVLDAEQKPKYLNSPETVIFQKSRELYGLHQILHQQKSVDYIIVVEGYMDVIALAQHGVMNAVATLGTATSTYHIQLLAKYSKALVFCFDGDNAGKQAAWRALESSLPHLNLGLDASFMFLPDGQDPDSLIRKEGKEQFSNRIKHRLNQLILDQAKTPSNDQMLTIARTPIRIAIALLLQHPEIYAKSREQINISLLDAQEQEILLKLLNQLAANPKANTATLIESWRNHPYFDSINRLAAWDHQVPEQELIKEFIDIVLFLQKQNRELTIRQLINKSHQQGLNDTEKILLQNLLKERHI
ncbi:MAG: DNA primase [Legionella longbeachae]|nr:DNA primase [Legionella longbeachae]